MTQSKAKRRWWPWLPIVFALAGSVAAGLILWGPSPQPSALHGVSGWGTGTHRASGCGISKATFYAWVRGGEIAFACAGKDPKSGGDLRVLAADSERVTMRRYALPIDSPLGEIVSLTAGPAGHFGLVYRTGDRERRLMMAIAGPAKWSVSPTPVPTAARSRLVGAGWRGDIMDVVVVPSSEQHRDGAMMSPQIHRVSPRGRQPTRNVSVKKICAGLTHCIVRYAYRPRDAATWRFVMDGSALRDRTHVWVSGEKGPSTPSKLAIAKRELARGAFDNARNGLFAWPDQAPVMLRPDGTTEVPPRPRTRSWRFSKRRPIYEVVDGQLRRRVRWQTTEKRRLVAQQMHGMFFLVEVRQGEAAPRVTFSIMEDERVTSGTAEALVDPSACPGLEWGVFAEDGSGGYVFASPQGCYLRLDGGLGRRDPLSGFEQAQRESPNEVSGAAGLTALAVLLMWMLAGFNFAFLGGLIFGLVKGRILHRMASISAASLAISAILAIVWAVSSVG